MPKLYDEADGMESRQCSAGGQPSSWKTDSGKLLFPTVSGVSVFDPKRIPVKTDSPNVVIEDVLADGVSVFGKEGIVVSHTTDRIEIRFTAFDFTAPEKIRFRYRLEGIDPGFINVHPRQRRAAEYLNLKPGRYRFAVYAANNDGVWNTEGAAVAFEVLSPFYRTSLFYIICAACVLSLSGIVVYARHRKTVKKRLSKYKTSTLDPARAEATVPKLLQLMEEEKIYLNPDLTLQELARRLRIHYNHLSRIINERFGLSYNDFVNKYRIEEVKKRLIDPSEKEHTVLEIMYDTGFYSKSVFNIAFKRFTGMTPSDFRSRNFPE
jgi:AraC-like DNA-binding protein